MYVSRQAIKIKTKPKKKKRIYFTQNEISISSVTTTFEMMTERGGESPKTGLLARLKQARFKPQASRRVALTV